MKLIGKFLVLYSIYILIIPLFIINKALCQNSVGTPALVNAICVDPAGKLCGTGYMPLGPCASLATYPAGVAPWTYPTNINFPNTTAINAPNFRIGLRSWLDANYVQNSHSNVSPTLTQCQHISPNTNGYYSLTTRLIDMSGNGNHAETIQSLYEMGWGFLQGNSTTQSTAAAIFDAVPVHRLKMPTIDLSATSTASAVTVFAVYNGSGGVWGQDENNGARYFYSNVSFSGGVYSRPGNDVVLSGGPNAAPVVIPGGGGTGVQVATVVYDGTSTIDGSAYYRNGVMMRNFTDGTAAVSSTSYLGLGASNDGSYALVNPVTTNPLGGIGSGFSGAIAEFIVYNRKLSICEINTINKYLCDKYLGAYAPPAISHNIPNEPDYSVRSCGPVLLSSTAAGAYQWQKFVNNNWVNVPQNSVGQDGKGQTYSVESSGLYTINYDNSCVALNAHPIQIEVLPPLNTSFAISPGAAPYPPNFPLNFSVGTQLNVGQLQIGTTFSYTWDWGDGTPATTTSSSSYSHAFAQGVVTPYNVRVTITRISPDFTPFYNTTTCSGTSTQAVAVYRPLCESETPINRGSFVFNAQTGTFDFKLSVNDPDYACVPATSLECLSGQAATTGRVVAVSMTAFTDTLVQNEPDYRPGSIDSNPFLQGKGQLRPYATYTFQAPLAVPASPALNLNYVAGSFAAANFSPKASARARPAAWIAASIAERVSPNGEVLQERDPLGVHSAAKYGYGSVGGINKEYSAHSLPYLQAHNAEANAVLFESFENIYTAGSLRGEDQFVLRTAEVQTQLNGTQLVPSHTGANAGQLVPKAANQYQLTLKSVPLSAQLVQEGLLVKFWLYLPQYDLTSDDAPVAIGTLEVADASAANVLRSVPLNLVAQTGRWCLAEAKLALPLVASGKPTLIAGSSLLPRLQIQLPSTITAPQLWIDDIRLQPGGSQMTAYVYDPLTFRLVATFDDQNYALLYQYNEQGQLIRKQAETVRGIKTLQETFYHTPTQ